MLHVTFEIFLIGKFHWDRNVIFLNSVANLSALLCFVFSTEGYGQSQQQSYEGYGQDSSG